MPLNKVAQNEQAKLLASVLTTAATSSVTVGILGPIAAALYGVSPADTPEVRILHPWPRPSGANLPKPIPVHGIRVGAPLPNPGSAFLVSGLGQTWLTTCVHLLTGEIKTPRETSFDMTDRIKVLDPDLEVPLAMGGICRATVVPNTTTGCLVDALTIRLDATELAALSGFGAFSLDGVRPVHVGQTVRVAGYPGIQETAVPHTAFRSKVAESAADLTNFRLEKPSKGGYSGGPVTAGAHLVGIATGDVGAKPNLIHGLCANLALLKPYLFR